MPPVSVQAIATDEFCCKHPIIRKIELVRPFSEALAPSQCSRRRSPMDPRPNSTFIDSSFRAGSVGSNALQFREMFRQPEPSSAFPTVRYVFLILTAIPNSCWRRQPFLKHLPPLLFLRSAQARTFCLLHHGAQTLARHLLLGKFSWYQTHLLKVLLQTEAFLMPILPSCSSCSYSYQHLRSLVENCGLA